MATLPHDSYDTNSAGGFIVQNSSTSNAANPSFGLLSPAASSATAASSVTGVSMLPSQRRRPLKAGSAKESSLINYLDAKIRSVQRRFGLRVVGGTAATVDGLNEHDKSYKPDATATIADDDDDDDYNMEEELGRDSGLSSKNTNKTKPTETKYPTRKNTDVKNKSSQTTHNVQGYTSFVQAATDISRLVSVVWVSGTPSLQIHYLLSLALLVTTYIPEFPVAPRSMFAVLRKLDLAFASLAQGRDLDTGEVLSGFWGSGGDDGSERSIPGISETTKVRIRSLVERTRVVVVDVMNNSDVFEEEDVSLEREGLEQLDSADEEADNGFDLDEDPAMDDDWDMEIARVYDRTLVELGSVLGSIDDAMVLTD